MKLIGVGAAVLNQTPLDWDGNIANILACIGKARDRGVSILCLPELCITGYGCEDAFFARGVQETALAAVQKIVPSTNGLLSRLDIVYLEH